MVGLRGLKQENLTCFATIARSLGILLTNATRSMDFHQNFKFKGGRRIAAMVQANDQENLAAVLNPGSQNIPSVPSLTQEQSSQLMALLQNVQLNKTEHNAKAFHQGSEYNTPATAFTSFAGPFIEEASGS